MQAAAPVISKCTFIDNYSMGHGGGLFLTSNNESPTIESCDFFNNTANLDGGGAYLDSSLFAGKETKVSNTRLSFNLAKSNGGGMYVSGAAQTSLHACDYSNNEALNGGGVYSYNTNPYITNCTFSRNLANLEGFK
jgi:hypothetical protein